MVGPPAESEANLHVTFALPAAGSASYDATAMESIEQLKATYAGMTEDELADVASDAYDLTDTARQVLRVVISSRGLNIVVKTAPPTPNVPEPDTDNEEDSLIVVASPRSRNDAAKIQAVLNASGVRSCLGPDNAENVESFHGTFDKPVALKVYLPFSGKASTLIDRLQKSIPQELEYDAQVEDEEEEEDDELEYDAQAGDGQEEDEVAEGAEGGFRCPKCHSDEVVFDNRESDGHQVDPEAAREDAKFDWHCDACGYQWQDDGIEK